jgi:cell division protein ZapA
MPNSETITVEIYNVQHTLQLEGRTPLEVSGLADHVNKKIDEIVETSKIADTSKVGILAALNIAEELFKLRDNKEDINKKSEGEVQELIKLIDSTLSD